MRTAVYYASIVLSSVALFWPLFYGRFPELRELPGDPSVQAVGGLLLFGALAYMTYKDGNEKEVTAS
jgi:hypothetical protein